MGKDTTYRNQAGGRVIFTEDHDTGTGTGTWECYGCQELGDSKATANAHARDCHAR
ncbi:hypothetical protein OG589_14410 [Sphaerisporangium sp. NBC_01403]|uniref:hypothetical protein n=1 Tax=Sphaerisporangium sp. NBC_01403 TaxID=2903599 RepID=UPI00324A0987